MEAEETYLESLDSYIYSTNGVMTDLKDIYLAELQVLVSNWIWRGANGRSR